VWVCAGKVYSGGFKEKCKYEFLSAKSFAGWKKHLVILTSCSPKIKFATLGRKAINTNLMVPSINTNLMAP
jgi:hypothetical protein